MNVERRQHPNKALVQLIIDRFEVLQVHLLSEDHLAETLHKVRIEDDGGIQRGPGKRPMNLG